MNGSEAEKKKKEQHCVSAVFWCLVQQIELLGGVPVPRSSKFRKTSKNHLDKAEESGEDGLISSQ